MYPDSIKSLIESFKYLPGIGEKTALNLLQQYETVQGVYEHIDEIKGKLKEKLIDGKELAELSLFLATIVRDADIPVTLDACTSEIDEVGQNEFFKKYEMKSLIKEITPKVEEKVEEKPQPREVKIEVERLAGPKVVDKIDLSQFDKKKKKKKRERIGKDGSQKVDVTKVEADNKVKKDKNKGGQGQQNNGQKQQQRPADQQQGKNNKKNRRDRGGDKFKPMTEAEQEEMQKEIQKQIKETYARMNEGKKGNFGAKHRKEKREAASQRMMEEMEMQQLEQKVLKGTEYESDYLAFAEGEFGLDKSQVSRFIRINDKFSVGGNPVELLPQYQGFGSRTLGIMIMLPE